MLSKSKQFSTITLKTKLDSKTFNNITYKFFKSQYLIYFDNYSGYTRLSKLEQINF